MTLVVALLAAALPFESLAPGVDYAELTWGDRESVHVVRIDPSQAKLEVLMASQEGRGPRTAGDWADDHHLVVAINAGMFAQDHLSNVGHLESAKHVNQSGWNDARSVLALGEGHATLVDLDSPGSRAQLTGFSTLLQDLRLVKAPGVSVWGPSKRRWSEAAIAFDTQGRVLFIFSRAPLSMAEFNRRLLALHLGIVRAMHAEGGPEASLSIRAPGRQVDLCGSYETDFNENDDNTHQWPVPNVLAVRAR